MIYQLKNTCKLSNLTIYYVIPSTSILLSSSCNIGHHKVREAFQKIPSKLWDIYQKGGMGSEIYDNNSFYNCDISGDRNLCDTISLPYFFHFQPIFYHIYMVIFSIFPILIIIIKKLLQNNVSILLLLLSQFFMSHFPQVG